MSKDVVDALWRMAGLIVSIVGIFVPFLTTWAIWAIATHKRRIETIEACAKEYADDLHAQYQAGAERRQAQHEETVQRLAALETSYRNLDTSVQRIDQKLDKFLFARTA